ncbi:MAG: aminotransferase class IV [Bacteroidota bacterium]
MNQIGDIVFWNQKFTRADQAFVSVCSHSFQYGTSVFEGIRSYETAAGARLFKVRDHYKRFLHAAKSVGFEVSYTLEQLVELSYELLRRNNLTDAFIKPLLISEPDPQLMPAEKSVLCLMVTEWIPELASRPSSLGISKIQRPDPASLIQDAKISGQYIHSLMAASEAGKRGFDDAVLLDNNGYVAEASTANIFFEKDDVLYTPPCGNILPGITRQTIIDLARELDISLSERFITPEFMLEADSAFLTSTSLEVCPVERIENHILSIQWEDSAGYMLAEKYKKLTTERDNFHFTVI